jgi:AcrR family transcriptional regulator
MPRAHTDAEQARIRGALLASGRDRFVRVGLVKTTVAELARDAGIGKGSFYHFFESKEALFFAVQEEEEKSLEANLRAELERAASGREAVRILLLAVSTQLERHPFLKVLLDPEVIATLLVRMPAEELAEHRLRDRERYVTLAQEWRARGWIRANVDPEDLFAVVTATFALSLERDLMGEDAYRRASREIAEAMAERWCD